MTQLKSTSNTTINTTSSYLPVFHWQLMENNSNARTCKLSRAESTCIEIRKWCPPKQEKQVQIILYDQCFSSGVKTKLSEKKRTNKKQQQQKQKTKQFGNSDN